MSLLNKKRISIRNKIFIGVGLFIIVNILLNLIIVKVSINDIYIGMEKRELNKQFKLIKKRINDENSLFNTIYDAGSNAIKIKILDGNLNTKYSLFSDKLDNDYTYLDVALLSNLDNNESKIVTLKNYKKSGYDLHLVGKIDSNNYVTISSSIETIKKNASTTTIILLTTSCITLLILTVFSFIMSELFSKKINEVKEVTDDIAKLKFDKKIEVSSNDEIGDLLNNVNDMSSKLEDSIKKLEETNEKLKQDLSSKEKQEKARKQLIANISHEFKTPLTIISGYSQLLLEDVKGKENKENINIMIDEAGKLSDLVHELLELSKIESGNLELKLSDTNIKEIIDRNIKKLNISIKNKKITIHTNYCDDNIIKVDSKLINRAVENTITNAIKFCKYDMKIDIKTHIKDGYYIYEIFNTGDNIDKKDLEMIFNSYYKEKSSRNKDGTGLGLAIVKAIIDVHSGICECHNEKNGVRFIIKIKVQ